MDNLTHSLVGAVLGQAGLKRKTGLAMPALIIGANIPDVDASCFLWLEGIEHVGFRRGITHGPPAMLLLPLVLAGALWWFDRWQTKRGKRPEGRLPVRFGWLYALSLLGCLTHPAMDWLNVYGVRFLEPFSSVWSYGDTLFIIDVWLWAMLIGSVWWSWRREKRGGNWTKPARIGIVVGSAYIFANGVITGVAEHRGDLLSQHVFGIPEMEVVASPPPIYFWEREILFRKEVPVESGGGALFGTGHFSVFEDVYFETRRGRVGRGDRITLDTPVPEPRWDYLNAYSGVEYEIARKGAERNSEAAAFLFWSRMPLIYIDQTDDGRWIVGLFDQRYMDPRAVGQFHVSYREDGQPVEPLAP